MYPYVSGELKPLERHIKRKQQNTVKADAMNEERSAKVSFKQKANNFL